MANSVKMHHSVGSSECSPLPTAHLDPKMSNLLEKSYRVLFNRERRGRDHCIPVILCRTSLIQRPWDWLLASWYARLAVPPLS